MLRRSPLLLLLSLASLLLAGCYYSHPRHTDHWTGQREAAVDSEYFVQTHFYWTGYNFEAVDSLRLATQPPLTLGGNYEFGLADSVTVYHRDPLVVARVLFGPGDTVDSVWVKVARDQWTQGAAGPPQAPAHGASARHSELLAHTALPIGVGQRGPLRQHPALCATHVG